MIKWPTQMQAISCRSSIVVLLITGTFLLPTSSLLAQTYEETIDSLLVVLNENSNPHKQVDLLNEISYAYRRISVKKMIDFAQQAKNAAIDADYKAGLAVAFKNLGNGHYKIGSPPDTSNTYYKKALLTAQEIGDHYTHAASLNNLATLYRFQGRYSEAESLFQQALTTHRQQLGDDHPDTATSLNNLATLYDAQRRYSEAEPLYQQALSIIRQRLGNNHPVVALGLNNLAGLYDFQGRYSEAESLYQQALTIIRQRLGDDHPDTAIGLNNLAGLYQAQGRYREAESLYQQALTIRRQQLGDDHPDTAQSFNNLALLYQAQGKYSQATTHLEKGTKVEENNLAAILTTGSERRKRAYLATASYMTDIILSLHLQDSPNNAEAARLALARLLLRKGRSLDAASNEIQVLRQNLTAIDQQLLDQLNATRTQIANLIFKGVGNSDPGQYRQQVAQLKGQADQLETQLSQRSGEFRIAAQPVTITAVQQQVSADAALVELVRYEPFNTRATGTEPYWGSPRYAAYVLKRQGELQWVDLGEAAVIDALVADFAVALRRKDLPESQVKAAAQALDERLFSRIQPLLGNARHLLLSPDGQLNRIPFAALVDKQGNYRIETYQMTYLTSGRDLLRLQLSPASRQAPVLLADASFHRPGDPTPVAVAPGEGDRSRSQRASDFGDLTFQTLPGTRQEIDAIASLLPDATLLTDNRATENTVKRLQGPDILHIATHGFFLKDAPLVAPPTFLAGSFRIEALPPPPGTLENPLLRSGLALAGANKLESGSEDGILTALEVSGLDLYGTQLVVLSACETGVGEVANGDGIYGLRRALVLAGSRSQTISLWKVDDAGTKDWMVAYYQKLLQGVGRSEAVRQVQLQMLRNSEDPRYQHPYYWAAFIPSGDWQPLP